MPIALEVIQKRAADLIAQHDEGNGLYCVDMQNSLSAGIGTEAVLRKNDLNRYGRYRCWPG